MLQIIASFFSLLTAALLGTVALKTDQPLTAVLFTCLTIGQLAAAYFIMEADG